MTPLAVEPLVLPQSTESPDAGGFLAAAGLFNAHQREIWGNDDFCETPQAQLARLQSTPTRRRQLLVARSGSGQEILGVAQLNFPLTDNLHTGTVNVVVDARSRRRGIGAALCAAAGELASADGRRTLIAETEHPLDGGEERAGGGPASFIPQDAAASFASACGFSLELVERISRLDLPVDGPGEGFPGSAAGAGYELVFWQDACPDALVDAYAQLRQKMSTDAPLGGLDLLPEVWDVPRVREAEGKARGMGYDVLVCAVRHTASGELAGHTVLEVARSNPAVAYQDDTLVLHRHRGNRLGMMMKAGNLRRLGQLFPEVQRVYTWNAEENRYMLAINLQLGFRAIGYSGEWQKELSLG
ncbi:MULTISPECIES: GNAT family N-acetyltransferase [Arthrobacter]|uniref:GNAT family N-acetyltransferase n=1 Tax=Arthrobacter TaxID=1663 RepID=UPI001D158EE2|nr:MULTISPECIES: GNAT family N-acetyltransferase [Arthrobacter]MCC3281218.1 GNAT family N-acetyltransferase [Arthrobacter caoxuetaonis]MCC9192607.1 GNAT family N-acetyltransferase [Arthrobacter sp. zg-Y916]